MYTHKVQTSQISKIDQLDKFLKKCLAKQKAYSSKTHIDAT